MKTLKVKNVVSLEDKNQKTYSKIELSTPDSVMQGGIKVKIEPKTQNIVKYPESYLPDGSPQYGHDFQIGDNVAGDIVTKANLIPYNIVDPTGTVTRQATSASHVVLGDTDNADAFEAATWREFHSRGKFLNDGNHLEAYAKFWGFAPETGEMVNEPAEAEEATL